MNCSGRGRVWHVFKKHYVRFWWRSRYDLHPKILILFLAAAIFAQGKEIERIFRRRFEHFFGFNTLSGF